MRYAVPQIVFGFHGCDRSVGEKLLSGKTTLKPSKNSYDWLGHGIYFWENAPLRAMQWARECAANPGQTKGKISDPYVIGAIINLGNCLNLTSLEDQTILKDAYRIMRKAFSIFNKKYNTDNVKFKFPCNTEKMRDRDCMVINTAVRLQREMQYDPFDTVRGAFVEGKPIYPGAKLNSKTHIQICVRNPDCICGYFLPSVFMKNNQ